MIQCVYSWPGVAGPIKNLNPTLTIEADKGRRSQDEPIKRTNRKNVPLESARAGICTSGLKGLAV